MTDKNTELPQKKQPETAPMTPKPEPASRPAPAPAKTNGKRRGLAGKVLLVAVLVIIVLAAALWYQQRQFNTFATQLQQQAGSSASAAQQAGQQAQQALAQAQQQQAQIAALQTDLRDAHEQLDSLGQAFQLITDSGSELVLLNDIDHLVTIAQQQLQLGGNVANAIISLETAQAQLARANRPGLASLQQTINGDLERLRAASTIDVALVSSQLDEFSHLVSQAPLLVPDQAAPKPIEPEHASSVAQDQAAGPADAASEADRPWWRQGFDTAGAWATQAWRSVSKDLGNFIDVRRVDDASALLMSPDQASRFRDNLRLRIMTAQLALMMHQPGIWEAETDALYQAVERRFDPRSLQTQQALKLARQFADTPIDVRVPTVDNSLQAIEVLREERDRTSQNSADQPGQTAEPDNGAPDSSPDSTPGPASGDAPSDVQPQGDNAQPDQNAPASSDAEPQQPGSTPDEAPGASSTSAAASPVVTGDQSSDAAVHARTGASSLNQS